MLQAPPITGQPHPPRFLAAPRPSRVLGTDLVAMLGAFALCVVGLWVRHGGLTALTHASAYVSKVEPNLAAVAMPGVTLG